MRQPVGHRPFGFCPDHQFILDAVVALGEEASGAAVAEQLEWDDRVVDELLRELVRWRYLTRSLPIAAPGPFYPPARYHLLRRRAAAHGLLRGTI